jgi:hypothetical protein
MTTVETPRLRLRPMQASGAEPFLEIHQDPEVINMSCSVLLRAGLSETDVHVYGIVPPTTNGRT